jgi:hypothetical protein
MIEAVERTEGRGATILQLETFLKAGGEKTIGAFCFWSLNGVHVERRTLREAFERIGMQAAVPRDPRFQTLLSTAMAKLPVGKRNVVARRHAGGWAILVEEQDLIEQKLKLMQVAHVAVASEASQVAEARAKNPSRMAPELRWKFMGTPSHVQQGMKLAQEVELEFCEARLFADTADMSTILTNCMHGTTKDAILGAVSLRQTTGGLYFVHATRVAAARELAELVQRLAPQSVVTVLSLTADQANLEAAATAARTSFSAQLAALRDEVEKFRSETPLGERTDRNIATRAAHFAQLRARVELFRDVLGSVAGELASDIERAKTGLESLLDEP